MILGNINFYMVGEIFDTHNVHIKIFDANKPHVYKNLSAHINNVQNIFQICLTSI